MTLKAFLHLLALSNIYKPLKLYKPIENYNVSWADQIKKNIDIPVIVTGGIRKKQDVIDIITEKKADMISMCRPFIIEPDIVKRFKEDSQEASRCINCGFCLFGLYSAPLQCYYGKIKN